MKLIPVGTAVEVWRAHREQWVPGEVLDRKDEGDATSYFVQLSGYGAAQATDPNSWFVGEQLRIAD